jgi:hypothetical protein
LGTEPKISHRQNKNMKRKLGENLGKKKKKEKKQWTYWLLVEEWYGLKNEQWGRSELGCVLLDCIVCVVATKDNVDVKMF